MSRSCRMIHGCCCFEFNWRTGITTISFITETIQLAISYLCILLLKCLKTHIDSTILKKGKVQLEQQIVSPSLSTINELKVFYFIMIIYALVIFIFGIICSILLISGAKTCQPNAILAWLIYQAFFVASSFVITYILIKV
ncbi:hypothetical protein PVAND_008367 [Polypedilum vanderplanki]|uniref:Uncharacterized protein n=1 Tax=Polypedilum vanderplanki TaxID=319348 RepID=A0A9J6C9S1_POLVA|nr:hypothetical protein PVAND_008367 [Polypedilum vanderplanki]